MLFRVWFSGEFPGFRCEEFAAAAGPHAPAVREAFEKQGLEKPWVDVEFPTDEAVEEAMKNSVLAKAAYEVFHTAETHEQVIAAVAADPQNAFFRALARSATFRFTVLASGRHMRHQEKLKLYEPYFARFAFPAVSLAAPDVTLTLLLEHASPAAPPFRVALAREVAASSRPLVGQLELKKRPFLGTTSMDAELSLVMCTLARVRRGHVVMDPFVGTGSILVAAAALGAYTLGSDLNPRFLVHERPILHRKVAVAFRAGETATFASNFAFYGLDAPDLLLADATALPFRGGAFLDAIVCDPPYGVRERASKEDMTVKADPAAIYTSLVDTAARFLVVGARLVFCYPVPLALPFDAHLDLPAHPAFQLVCAPLQRLSSRYGRLFVVMEKAADAAGAARFPRAPDFKRFYRMLYEKGPTPKRGPAPLGDKQ